LYFSGVQDTSLGYSHALILNGTFLSQIKSNVSSRLYTRKLLPNTKLLQCIKTDGNSNPRIHAIGKNILHDKYSKCLFDKSECCQILFMLWNFTFHFCKYWHSTINKQMCVSAPTSKQFCRLQ